MTNISYALNPTFAVRRKLPVAGLTVSSFTLVMASPNLPTALLPDYRATYQLTSWGLSMVFTSYLLVLVPAMVLCTQPWFAARARSLLLIALAGSAISSVVLATAGSALALGLGRGICGLAVGLATGATAALLAGLRGEGGRAVVATASLTGGLVGTVAGLSLAALGRGVEVYWIHATASGLLLIVLGIGLADSDSPAAGLRTSLTRAEPASRSAVRLGTAAGVLGWTAPGLVIALLPALLREISGPSGVLVAGAPVVLFLLSAWGMYRLATVARWRSRIEGHLVTIGVVVCVVGLVLIAAAALTASVPLAYLGAVFAAAGPGLAYRGGLALVTTGLDATAQGVVTSRYTATSYGTAALLILGCGAVGANTSIGTALAGGSLFLAIAGVLIVVSIRRWEVSGR